MKRTMYVYVYELCIHEYVHVTDRKKVITIDSFILFIL